ncbi:MAG: enoyl-CoA hydratase/isomerase family protein [Acidobacteriota bacterium]
MEINLEDHVLRVTLNRPEKRNALSLAMCGELADALERAEADDSIGCVLLEAKGKVFCAGMDLDEALEGDAAAHSAAHERVFTFGSRLSVPVVAAAGGPALGGGLGLLANAHIVVAAQGASFGLTEIRLGMWPFVVYRAVARAIGERRAVELGLTGRIFGTQEALAWGLVQHVVPAFELDDRAWRIASSIASFSRDTVRRGMAFVNESRGLGAAEAGALAARARKPVFEGPDFREGVEAFRQKRPPKWS